MPARVNLYLKYKRISTANPVKTGGAKLEGLTAEVAYDSQLQKKRGSNRSASAIWLSMRRLLFYYQRLCQQKTRRHNTVLSLKGMNAAMKKWIRILTRRVLPAVTAVLLLAALSASSLAEPGKSNHGSGKPDTNTAQHGNSGNEKGSGQEKNEEKSKRTYRGISTEQIALAIGSVTDEATRLELTAMLEAYMTALGNKDAALANKDGSLSELSRVASEARAALKNGLESAGFTLGSVLGWKEWKEYGNIALDLEAIAAAIGALDDADANKAALDALFAVYKEALNAKETGAEENEEALEQAEETARESLLEALFETGIFPLQDVVPDEAPETQE